MAVKTRKQAEAVPAQAEAPPRPMGLPIELAGKHCRSCQATKVHACDYAGCRHPDRAQGR